jgi:hypothetical protein
MSSEPRLHPIVDPERIAQIEHLITSGLPPVDISIVERYGFVEAVRRAALRREAESGHEDVA